MADTINQRVYDDLVRWLGPQLAWREARKTTIEAQCAKALMGDFTRTCGGTTRLPWAGLGYRQSKAIYDTYVRQWYQNHPNELTEMKNLAAIIPGITRHARSRDRVKRYSRTAAQGAIQGYRNGIISQNDMGVVLRGFYRVVII